jgi:hypothetical protein
MLSQTEREEAQNFPKEENLNSNIKNEVRSSKRLKNLP